MDSIEAVTCSVGYGDFLSAVIPHNAPLFDKWIIVTSPEDKETRNLCRKHGLECLITEDGTAQAGEFRKGRMIERGLQHLSSNAWRIHIDADIVLPSKTRQLLEMAELSKEMIYGCDRAMIPNWNEWVAFQATGWLQSNHFQYQNYISFPKYPMGARWADLVSGWCPIGFFQMWHSSADLWHGSRIKRYNDKHNDACRTDTQHSLQFDRKKRALIPELIAVHLDSEGSANGTNWKGRKSARFGPPNSADNQLSY
jgi:hypothetical protein